MGRIASVSIGKKAEGFIVVCAESLKQAPWWLYHTLVDGDNSWDTLQVEDVDNFCVYHVVTRKIAWMTGDGKAGHIFRIHDDNHVAVNKKSDTEAIVIVLASHGPPGFNGIHQCVGRAHPGCGSEVLLKLNSQGLAYPWELPKHIDFASKKNIQWEGPK